MSSDRAIRRDEGERLARVSISFTTVQPELMWFIAVHCCLLLSASSGVFGSFHGDKCQDGSERGAGLYCRGQV